MNRDQLLRRRRHDKQHAPPLPDRLEAERDREVRLAGADRTGEDDVFRARDPVAARQLGDLPFARWYRAARAARIADGLTHVVQGQKSGVSRKPDDGEDKAAAPEVSTAEEPAAKEADAVADKVADEMHDGDKQDPQSEKERAHSDHKGEGGADDKGHEAEAKETKGEPAKISAKLEGVGRKVWLAPSSTGGTSAAGASHAGIQSAEMVAFINSHVTDYYSDPKHAASRAKPRRRAAAARDDRGSPPRSCRRIRCSGRASSCAVCRARRR